MGAANACSKRLQHAQTRTYSNRVRVCVCVCVMKPEKHNQRRNCNSLRHGLMQLFERGDGSHSIALFERLIQLRFNLIPPCHSSSTLSRILSFCCVCVCGIERGESVRERECFTHSSTRQKNRLDLDHSMLACFFFVYIFFSLFYTQNTRKNKMS